MRKSPKSDGRRLKFLIGSYFFIKFALADVMSLIAPKTGQAWSKRSSRRFHFPLVTTADFRTLCSWSPAQAMWQRVATKVSQTRVFSFLQQN
jgi:hypothetical protein